MTQPFPKREGPSFMGGNILHLVNITLWYFLWMVSKDPYADAE